MEKPLTDGKLLAQKKRKPGTFCVDIYIFTWALWSFVRVPRGCRHFWELSCERVPSKVSRYPTAWRWPEEVNFIAYHSSLCEWVCIWTPWGFQVKNWLIKCGYEAMPLKLPEWSALIVLSSLFLLWPSAKINYIPWFSVKIFFKKGFGHHSHLEYNWLFKRKFKMINKSIKIARKTNLCRYKWPLKNFVNLET